MRSGAVAEGLSVPLMVLGGTRFKYQPAWLPSQRRCRIHFRPEVEEQASHVTLRGAHSNSSKRELVVMAAPEPEVLSLAAVLGKAWGPLLGELWGPVSHVPPLPAVLSPWPFLWAVFLVPVSQRPSQLWLSPTDSIALPALDPIGSLPLSLPLGGVLDFA